MERLRKELEEKESKLSELMESLKEPDEIIDIAVKAAQNIKIKAMEELERAFGSLPPSFKPMVSNIMEKIRKQLEG